MLPSHRIVLFGREKLDRESGAAGSEHLLWRDRALKPHHTITGVISEKLAHPENSFLHLDKEISLKQTE